jgi:hypothetical protein
VILHSPIWWSKQGRRINLPPPAHCGQNTAARPSTTGTRTQQHEATEIVSLLSSQIGRPPGPCQSGIRRLRATGTKLARRGCQPAGCSSAAPMHKHWSTTTTRTLHPASCTHRRHFLKTPTAIPTAADRHLGRLYSLVSLIFDDNCFLPAHLSRNEPTHGNWHFGSASVNSMSSTNLPSSIPLTPSSSKHRHLTDPSNPSTEDKQGAQHIDTPCYK